jgi:nucleoside-diphosphate-sugar epimerase
MPSDDVGTTVLVTGATGFIGRHVVAVLHERGYRVIAVSRRAMSGFDQSPTRLRNLVIDDFTSGAAWDAALSGVDVVIHIAGLAHLPRATQRDFLRFESDNVAVSRELAAAAVRKSVRRMVFLSSAGVHGASTAGRPFCSSDLVRPYDAYTESKASAERIVQQISSGSTTEWVVVRAPMVIGRNSPGNFSRLASLVGRRVPLPFANIDNRRSVISVWN